MFLESADENPETWTSDHNPILMTVVEKGRRLRYNRRTFHHVHYEDLWSSYDECREIVKQKWSEQGRWSNADAVECFKKATKESIIQLLWWNREVLGDISQKLEKLIKELKEVKKRNLHYEDGKYIKSLERQIDGLLLDEEIY